MSNNWLMDFVTASFNTTVRQMTKMSQRMMTEVSQQKKADYHTHNTATITLPHTHNTATITLPHIHYYTNHCNNHWKQGWQITYAHCCENYEAVKVRVLAFQGACVGVWSKPNISLAALPAHFSRTKQRMTLLWAILVHTVQNSGCLFVAKIRIRSRK